MNQFSTEEATSEPDRPVGTRLSFKKLLVLSTAVLAGIFLFWKFGHAISFDYLASRESDVRAWQADSPFVAAVTAVALYIIVAGLSLPGAAILTISYGWLFGFWQGLVVSSFGSTGGAMVAFLLSRYLLRDWVQSKLQSRVAAINDAFQREGAFYLFTLRLVPAVPFFVINAVMGLTTIRARTFWWVSQLGMLPGAAAYVYAGSAVPNVHTLAEEGVGTVVNRQLLLAFVALGVLPLVIKRVVGLLRRINHKSGNRMSL